MFSHNSHGSVSTTHTISTEDSGSQSTISYNSRCPDLILDSSSPVFTSIVKSPVELIGSMHNLHIPIKTIDFLPRTETVIGPLLGDITMGTKVRTIGSTPLGAGPGELRADKLRASLRESLERAKTSRIGYLIAQRMDSMVSIGEVAGGFSGLIGEGVVEMWGVREFTLRDINNIQKTCQRRGFHKPRIYEGEYSFISRPKEELLSLLRSQGMRFHAYAPTANGILGRKTHNIGASSDGAVQSSAPESKDSQTPSLTGTPTSAWKGVNDTPTTRQAVKRINEAGERYGVSLLSASLRWLAYHSRLDSSDAIVLGASSWRDLEERVEELAKGPLPDGLVATMDEVGEFLGFSRTLH